MLRDKEFDVGISSTSERCLATPPKNNLCEFFRVQPTCGQEYRQEYETHTADSVSVSVSYSCLYSQKHLHMYTWNHMPHVRGAAEQPLLQTISGTTINDGLPCVCKLLDKSETTRKYLWTNMKTVWQGESDHGSTTRLDAQDISIAHVQCTE